MFWNILGDSSEQLHGELWSTLQYILHITAPLYLRRWVPGRLLPALPECRADELENGAPNS